MALSAFFVLAIEEGGNVEASAIVRIIFQIMKEMRRSRR
jgi:hypothetical protein